jgi:hypothetical protein
MVAMVQAPNGQPVSLHRTFLTADGSKASVKPVRVFIAGEIPAGVRSQARAGWATIDGCRRYRDSLGLNEAVRNTMVGST